MAGMGENPYYLEIAVKPLHRHKKTLRELGITECVVGGFSFFLAVIAAGIARGEVSDHIKLTDTQNKFKYALLYERASYSYICAGIWCGVLLILTGYVGMRVRVKPSRCIYVANLAMAIIAAFVNAVGTALSAVIAIISSFVVGLTVLHSIIALLCFVGMTISIIHSAFCCSGVCYNNELVARQQLMYAPLEDIEQPQPQYIQGPEGKFVMIANTPMTSQGSSEQLKTHSENGKLTESSVSLLDK